MSVRILLVRVFKQGCDDDDDFGGFAATLQPAFPLVLLSSAVSTSGSRELKRDYVKVTLQAMSQV